MAMNNDDYDYIHDKAESEAETHIDKTALHYAAAFTTLTFCISLSGNSFLLWVLRMERPWKTTSDLLLLQLTISNLCFTLTLPFAACNELHEWIFGEWTCGVGIGIYYLGLFTSVVILTAMPLYYYVTVIQASCLSVWVSRQYSVRVASVVMWLVCAAASIKLSVSSKVVEFGSSKVCVTLVESKTMELFDMYMEICLFFLIPFLIITFCYVHIWIMVKQGRINSHQQPSKLILWITVGTFLCLAPYNVHIFIQSLLILDVRMHTHEVIYALHYTWFIINPMTHTFCCLSPLVHIIGAQRFRRHLPMPCNKLSLCRDESDNDGSMAFIPLQNAEEM
ncbi:C-C chemokine receptor type 8-like [Archocentrus centrarchus]|uniref:C-C chemokine receptor type 8-like n=1 Tax=Archocentrus centrarchus TaxID=63155 RepID=UPI0011EA30A2|nr:C-C chemokine receptor type 8-like [Archocentrus centrarchus]